MTGVRVATPELIDAAGVLHRAAESLASVASALVDAEVSLHLLPTMALACDAVAGLSSSTRLLWLPSASAELAPTAGSAEVLGRLLLFGAFEYERGEQLAAALVGGRLDAAYYAHGRAARDAVLRGDVLGLLMHVGSAAAPSLGVLGEPDALSTAEGALAVRVLATQLDDFALGVAGASASEAYRPGALGTDITTLAAVALAALGGARAGSMNVRPVGEAVTVAPAGLRSLGARIPSAVAGSPQLRIERYGPVDAPRWIVYSTGTVDFGTNGTTVFDLRADIAAIADQTAASTVAADRAMRAAGIGPADPVLLVGHSQGGLVVQQLAESEAWQVDGVLTFGAPAAPHLGDVPVVAIEHSEDVVPAIVGFQPSHDGEAYANYRVDAMDGSTPVPDHVMPAHSMSMYEHTADRVEASGGAGVRAFLDELRRVAPVGAGGSVTWYLAQRPQVAEPGQTLIAPGRTTAADAGGVL